MRILKIYPDREAMKAAAVKMGTDMDKWVCNYHDMGYGFIDLDLANGIVFHFRTITTLDEAVHYTAGCVYPFVEFTSDLISNEAKDFIVSRIRDPKDYT